MNQALYAHMNNKRKKNRRKKKKPGLQQNSAGQICYFLEGVSAKS
jgi:hypothetical protein